jgi:hypothetical protein
MVLNDNSSSSYAICYQVLGWLFVHEGSLPVQLERPITSAQRAERVLRVQLDYLKLQTDQPSGVIALLREVKRITSQQPSAKQSSAVPPWFLFSEESQSCELPAPKRRRLLVKTKDRRLLKKPVHAIVASAADCSLKRTAFCVQTVDRTVRENRRATQKQMKEEKDQGGDENVCLIRERLDVNKNELQRVRFRCDGDMVDGARRDVHSSASNLFQRSVDEIFTVERALEQRFIYGNIFF